MTMCALPNPIRERRPERRVVTGKRIAMSRPLTGKARATTRRSLDPCDNSNDSGLGFDHHLDHRPNGAERVTWPTSHHTPVPVKRPRMDNRDIKVEVDELNENFGFPETARTCKDTVSIIRTAPSASTPSLSMNTNHSTTSSSRAVPRCTPLVSRGSTGGAITLISQLPTSSRDCDISLRIVSQPEQQHRARYQTEGSRGAVKDRSGNGFPVVQLIGYHKPATLQVFIGTDVGKVAPHMFYQACRVSGKNSTPCMEKKIDGTVVIELQLDPSKDMIGTCDCVGILKERNVDVEHRFPEQIGSRSKKKSTRCRMVFRTTIQHENGIQETLQVCSQPIVCTQPPGIPEICKKSLNSCPASGGLELFILGKNFLKDTRVFFQQIDEQGLRWEQSVTPDKEFLQQTHLVCVIPPYVRPEITEPITVRLLVVSSGKTSEPHQFVYTPTSGAVSSGRVESATAPFLTKTIWPSVALSKQEQGMMPPPGTSQIPISQRRPSFSIGGDAPSPPLHSFKQELMDENSQSSLIDATELRRERFRHISESSMDVQHGDSNLTIINENSMEMMRRNSVSMDTSSLSMEPIVRRNSCGRDNTLDVPLDSALTTLVARGRCDKGMLGAGLLGHAPPPMDLREDLKVMDLRMKMPSVTVSDLANTHAPSLAALHCFGVTEPTNIPLPAQSGQSVENYFTTIETKTVSTIDNTMINNKINEMMSGTQHGVLMHSHLANGEGFSQVLPPPVCREANLISNNVARTQTAVESELLTKSLNAGKIEPLLIGSKSPMMSQAVLAPPPNLLIPSTINTNLSSPILDQSEMSNAHPSTTISPEVIMNSQISPTIMCRSNPPLSQDSLLVTSEANLIQQVAPQPMLAATSPLPAPLGTEPEKAILLEAAVDLFETQKKICELDHQINPKSTIEQVILGNMLTTANANANEHVTTVEAVQVPVPITVKELGEKKNEDRMIPSGFATMSENELINIINPSCFDQV